MVIAMIENQHEASGISEARLERLMVEILDSAERVNSIFADVADLVAGTSNYFICESGNRFREQFETVKTSFPVVSRNILAYNDDLLAVKANYANLANVAIDNFRSPGNAMIDSFKNKKEGE